MKIIGISGSPIADSNTDRAVKAVLEATGVRKREFVKLSELTVAPCDACLGCVATNRCVLGDDGVKLADRVYKADAIVIGGYTPYGTIDSRTKAFLERLYPLRHRHGLLAGKPGAAVVTCATPLERPELPPSCENGLAAIRTFMQAENMRYVGGVAVLGNLPCVRCGAGQCGVSGLKMLYGPEAEVETVGIRKLEDDLQTMAALEKLGEEIIRACYGG